MKRKKKNVSKFGYNSTYIKNIFWSDFECVTLSLNGESLNKNTSTLSIKLFALLSPHMKPEQELAALLNGTT